MNGEDQSEDEKNVVSYDSDEHKLIGEAGAILAAIVWKPEDFSVWGDSD